jgi:hypothetical protein
VAYTCAAVAYKAGFSYVASISTPAGGYRSVVVAVAIGLAESSCNPAAEYTDPNGCEDRGLWQIDSCAWPSVTDACAYQVQCNGNAAWNISDKGMNWTPWSTYTSGAWKAYVPDARAVLSRITLTLSGQAAGKCLATKPGGDGNGAAVQLQACDSGNRHLQWTVIRGGSGANPVLKNVASGKCLDAKPGDGVNGGVIRQWTCNATGDPHQRWRVNGNGELNTDGHAEALLQNVGSRRCLATGSGVGSDSSAVGQWACVSGSGDEQWNLLPADTLPGPVVPAGRVPAGTAV